jgi:hypothetical protein
MAGQPIIKRVIGLETITVEATATQTMLRNDSTGVSIPISYFETCALLWSDEDQLYRFFAEQGGLDADGNGATSRLAAGAAMLAHGLPLSSQLLCLVDRTVIEHSLSAITQGWLVTPAAFIDLSTFCYTAVMHDHIVSDIDQPTLPDELGDIVLSIQLRSDPYREIHPHYNSAASIGNELRSNPEFASELNGSWSEFLRHPITLDYSHVDRATDSPDVWEYLPGNDILDYDPILHLAAGSRHLGREGYDRSVNQDVSIQTWRYFINERTAARIGVPYHCASLRFPIEQVALRRKISYRWLADSLLTSLLGEPKRPFAQGRPDVLTPRLKIPHPLSVVMGRSARREHFWDELLQLREEFRPVRERILSEREDGVLDGAIVQKLAQEITHASAGLNQIDGCLASASAIAGALPVDAAAASAALKVASTLRPIDLAIEAIRRLTKPELHILRSFVSEARRIGASIEDIDRLWDQPVDRKWFAALEHLNEAATLNAATLGG